LRLGRAGRPLHRWRIHDVADLDDAIGRIDAQEGLVADRAPGGVVDHDGDETRNGGILRWIKLAEATGLDRDRVMRWEGVLPATRFIGNEYLNLVRTRPFLECVASSLTELFSRDLITLRMEKLRQHYPWLSSGLDYFEARLTEAPEDAAFAIQYVFDHAATRAEQENAIRALRDKCDILWAQLDALYFAYVEPGWPPPGAFQIAAPEGNRG